MASGTPTLLLHLAWIVPLALLITFMSSPRFRGDIAESRVRRLLAAGLEGSRYTVFHDLVVPSGGGTTRIDHVVVSKFGIFVIESCYVRGWISGSEVQAHWRQHRWWHTTRFDNPVHANRLQVEALQRLLEYPGKVFVPAVVLVGHAGGKSPLPDHVLGPERLMAFIRKKSRQELTPEQADHAVQKISEAQLRSPRGWASNRWLLVRLLLVLLLLGGLWLAFRDDLARVAEEIERASERRAAPEQFHPDGTRKTEREIWEDSLICARSADTGRCSCYEPGGDPADVSAETCRALANRGSILER
jgi:hypothetical protein